MCAILALAVCLAASPAFAQTGTISPVPKQQFLDNNGNPLASGKLYTYAAGGTTPLSTYSDASLSVANANPIILDSAGRATIFLTAASYKFVLATSADVVIYTVDNVSSVAPFNVDLDVSGTAGEAIAAGDLVYLSDGSGSRTAGRWYKTDADLSYAAVSASEIGIAPAAIASGASGSIRVGGRVTGLSGLSTGSDYYASGTAGGLTATAPTMRARIGRADSSTSMVLGNLAVTPGGPRGPPCGRLTLTTGLAVTTADVNGAGTLYYTPYGGCTSVSVYDGSTGWYGLTLTEISIAVPAVANQVYDAFVYDNAGVLTIDLTAWTNDTTRATALVLQNGVYVKTGATTRLYVGTVRTKTASQITDSVLFRHVWNYYNQKPRPFLRQETTSSWTYTTAAVRQANANSANQVDWVQGVSEAPVMLFLLVDGINVGGNSIAAGMGLDSTGTFSINNWTNSQVVTPMPSQMQVFSGIGRHFASWNEYSTAAGTTTFYATNGFTSATFSNGITGWILG